MTAAVAARLTRLGIATLAVLVLTTLLGAATALQPPAAAAEIMANRVNVDTGAYMGGTLTALVVDGAAKRLIHA